MPTSVEAHPLPFCHDSCHAVSVKDLLENVDGSNDVRDAAVKLDELLLSNDFVIDGDIPRSKTILQ